MKKYPDLQTIYDHLRRFCFKDIEFTVFTQIFPDTAGLFRRSVSDFAGQAFTNYIITVACADNRYYIFQEETPVYMVTDPKEKFYKDLQKRTLLPLYKALKEY